MKPQCLCQLCSCGRHRCPRQCVQMTDARGHCPSTEYRNTFIRYPIETVQSFKPEVKPVLASEPISDQTTHKVDFIRHPLSEKFVHKSEPYHAPQGPFDGCTSYRTEFIRKPISPAHPVDKSVKRFCLPPFDAQTCNKTDFIRWPLDYQKVTKRDEVYQPAGPFDGNTMYKNSYIRHEIKVRKNMKPNVEAKLACEPLETSTEHKDQYIRHQLPEKVTRDKQDYFPLQCQMDDLTMYKKDFKRLELEPTVSFKPEIKARLASEPMDGNTTNRLDFIRWPLDRPFKHEKEPYVQPAGEMNCDTTHRLEYTRKPITVVKAQPKREQRKCILAPLDSCTTYKCEFLRWDAKPPKKHAQDSYFPISGPFDGNTSYRTDFIRMPSAVRQSLKPEIAAKIACEPLEDRTEYRNEFTRKPREPCVAGMIQAGVNSGYGFVNQDSSCHKWYQTQEVAA